jgi:hypothetical protein
MPTRKVKGGFFSGLSNLFGLSSEQPEQKNEVNNHPPIIGGKRRLKRTTKKGTTKKRTTRK